MGDLKHRLSRRAFVAAAAKATAFAAVGSTVGSAVTDSASGAAGSMGVLPKVPFGQFPSNFAWGTVTSAMQVEGYPYADGGGRSVWSVLDNDPAKVKDRSNNLIADDT